MRSEALPGRAFVRFQQQYAGVPVLGGELIVQLDGQRNTLSANGEILPDIQLDSAPRLDRGCGHRSRAGGDRPVLRHRAGRPAQQQARAVDL